MRFSSRTFRCMAIAFAAALAACSRPSTSLTQNVAAAPAAPAGGFASLNLTHDDPAVVGSAVHATATGLPGSKTAGLSWGTVSGGWVIEDYYHFRGNKYTETTTSLGRFPIDASGRLDARFVVPEDYGGVHEVIALVDGKPVAQGGVNVSQTFTLSPASGPIGTPIELKVTGLGWRTMESTWVVNWDNQELGFVTAAGTRGSAVGRFRAAGPTGDHVVKLYTGWQGQAYLNYEQSPVAALPRPQFTFRTTPGSNGEATYAERYQLQPMPTSDLKTGATLTLAPTQGPVGTPIKLQGSGFKAGMPLQLVWETYVGSRVSGDGFTPKESVIGDVKATSDGRVETSITVPEDLGGLHTVTLKSGDE